MASNRVAGLISLVVNGETYDAKGTFSWNTGRPRRMPVLGADGAHGYREEAQIAFIEGEISLPQGIDVDALVTQVGTTVTLTLGNDDVVTLENAWFAGEGTGQTDEGQFAVRWEARVGEYVTNS